MQSVAFISSLSQVRIKLIFFALIDHTYLERAIFIACTDDNLLEGSYSILRQVWWTLMAKTGFKGYLEAQVVSLLGANNLASMRGNGKLNMLDDPRQYNFSDMGKHNPLRCLSCPTSTFQHVIFQRVLTITKDVQDSIFICEISLPSIFFHELFK